MSSQKPRTIPEKVVYETLSKLKSDSIARNRASAREKKPDITDAALLRIGPSFGWWLEALRFPFDIRTSGNSQSGWSNPEWIADGAPCQLYMRSNFRHSGIIAPTTIDVCKKLTAMFKIPADKPLEMNDKPDNKKKPTFSCAEYRANDIKDLLDVDGITFKKDPVTGQPLLPPAEKRSLTYAAAELIAEAFTGEVALRVSRGAAILAKIDEDSRRIANDPSETRRDAAAIVDEVMGSTPRQKNDIFYDGDGASKIRGAYPTTAENAPLFANAYVASSIKVATPVQKTISGKAKKNAGQPLPSGICRFGMSFGKAMDNKNTKFHDGRTMQVVAGRTTHELATIDGQLINPDNVQLFVLPGSDVAAIVDFSSICFSNLAISLLANVLIAVVTPSEGGSGGASFDESDLYEGANASPAARAAAPSPAIAPSPAPSPVQSDINMDALMASMTMHED